MRLNYLFLGRLALPRGVAARCAPKLNRVALARRSVYQSDLLQQDKTLIEQRLERWLGPHMEPMLTQSDSSLLFFRNLETHTDDWRDIYYQGSWCKPGFLHVVLKGRFEVRVGGLTSDLQRGDVFLMNPSIPHSVRASRLCMTYCVTLPLHAVYSAFMQTQNSKIYP